MPGGRTENPGSVRLKELEVLVKQVICTSKASNFVFLRLKELEVPPPKTKLLALLVHYKY